MLTDQPVNNHDDMHKVTDNMLHEVGLSIDNCGGKVTLWTARNPFARRP